MHYLTARVARLRRHLLSQCLLYTCYQTPKRPSATSIAPPLSFILHRPPTLHSDPLNIPPPIFLCIHLTVVKCCPIQRNISSLQPW
ncbi:hypothetical protein P280DRAFT_190647 [Massarina eburnea CBS 473.64]|uniref:Uncharacterized protein n=1 Tax=Massarina eburnea CBS 473.64 TaxID=1395130 RepID=A0A6A6RJQ9_9PLEO|nr:hypothetical protein P280DRAFT_190647 [Massarina eburnea CBS 473.64]